MAPGRVVVIAGLFLTGVAYGGLQNLTLAQSFNAAGERRYPRSASRGT